MTDPLLVRHEGEIDIVSMNRPARLNALDETLTRALLDYFEQRRRDGTVRVILLTGSGRGFCAGADVRAFTAQGERPLEGLWDGDWRLRDLIWAMRACPQPVIALVNGPAAGGGLAFVLASDVVIAAEGAVFVPAFGSVGLSGAELGVAWRLQRAVGTALARDMCFTGRTLSAPEALQFGLASRVVAGSALMDCGLACARDMLAMAPDALRLTKRSMDAALESGFAATMELEERAQLLMMMRGATKF